VSDLFLNCILGIAVIGCIVWSVEWFFSDQGDDYYDL